MFDTAQQLYDHLGVVGEMMVVLDSGEEYDCHPTDTEIIEAPNGDKILKTEGINDEGEYEVARFGVDEVEHFRTHYEN